MFAIPPHLRNKVPPSWLTFLEDTVHEMKQVTSTVYDGAVQKNLKHGMGQILYPSGQKYRGNFKQDLRHGHGICQFTNGAIYKGDWKEGRPWGPGTLFSFPNELIEAKFDGFRILDNSQVKILFSNGEFYEGPLKSNQRHGHGNHHYENGDIYEGPWDFDKRGGKTRGNLKFKDGSALEAKFLFDQADGDCEFQDRFGNRFSSEMVNRGSKVDAGAFLNGRLYG